jgi:16S rRNA processing protein RimM
MTTQDELWLDVAVIGRPHGVRGTLYVHFSNPDSPLIIPGQKFKLQPPENAPNGDLSFKDLVIEKARLTQKGWLVTFTDVHDRNKAQQLTHSKLQFSRSELPPSTDESVYLVDLLDLSVLDQSETKIGWIKGFFFNGAHEVVTVELEHGSEVLLPFTKENLIDLDLESRQITLHIPIGIPGLNTKQ